MEGPKTVRYPARAAGERKQMTNTLCIATARNSWSLKGGGKWLHDGDYFVSEMTRFIRHEEVTHGADVVGKMYTSKNRLALRSRAIEDIQDNPGFDTLAFFCHGSWKWLFGSGHQIWNLSELASAIASSCYVDPATKQPRVTIILYACSCGRGKRVVPWSRRQAIVERSSIQGQHGFAHMLSAELGTLGVKARVFAHTAKGDTTRNPLLCRVKTDPKTLVTTTIHYREFIKQELGKEAWTRFCGLMRDDPVFRFNVPFMKINEVLDNVDDGC